MSNSSSSVYYLGPSHWFRQINNFSLSCPWAFGLLLLTMARLWVKQVLISFPFSLFPNAGAAGDPTRSAVGPFVTRGWSSGASPSQLRGCPLTRNPQRRGAFLLLTQTNLCLSPFLGVHEWLLLLLRLMLDHVLLCLSLPTLKKTQNIASWVVLHLRGGWTGTNL